VTPSVVARLPGPDAPLTEVPTVVLVGPAWVNEEPAPERPVEVRLELAPEEALRVARDLIAAARSALRG
jgi:hypothetical protein